MTDPTTTSVTALLRAAGAGNREALDRAFPLVYDELRRLAEVVRAGRASDTYNATALVHEAYLKLARSNELSWTDRAHFMSIAGRAMRQVLVDKAAERAALKRGGGDIAVTLTESDGAERRLGPEELLDLDRALTRLSEENPRAAKVVECRFFGAMSVDEIGAVLDVSAPTVTRDWRYARAWLTRSLSA